MLIEPVALSDFFLSFFSAALLIFTAALYAGCFAWARISGKRLAYVGAGLAYAGLLLCIVVFGRVNHFSGYWFALSAVMALGYALMPAAIWQLCVATHAHETDSHTSHTHDTPP